MLPHLNSVLLSRVKKCIRHARNLKCNYPQIRVAIQKERRGEEVFIFYEINNPKQKYFWFELIGIKEEIAKTISKKLIGIQAYSN